MMRKLCIGTQTEFLEGKRSFQASGSSIHHEGPKKGTQYKFNSQVPTHSSSASKTKSAIKTKNQIGKTKFRPVVQQQHPEDRQVQEQKAVLEGKEALSSR
jgi:hypothetical protein